MMIKTNKRQKNTRNGNSWYFIFAYFNLKSTLQICYCYYTIFILILADSNITIADWEKPKYSFSELTRMFESDYAKICKIYNKAHKQIEDNVKVAIPMENYKERLDIIHNGIITGELYEGCNNKKYIQAIEELGTTGTDFIMNFGDDYRK